MKHFSNYNPNPKLRRVGDCTVRAISMVTGQSWDETFLGLCAKGFELKDMPSSNAVWGAYLRDKGFVRRMIPDRLPEDYTVEDFCIDHPVGTYLLAISGHVVAVVDGVAQDSWFSLDEIPVFYWTKEQ